MATRLIGGMEEHDCGMQSWIDHDGWRYSLWTVEGRLLLELYGVADPDLQNLTRGYVELCDDVPDLDRMHEPLEAALFDGLQPCWETDDIGQASAQALHDKIVSDPRLTRTFMKQKAFNWGTVTAYLRSFHLLDRKTTVKTTVDATAP